MIYIDWSRLVKHAGAKTSRHEKTPVDTNAVELQANNIFRE